MSRTNSLVELKALIDREYVKAVMNDIDEMDLTQDEKDNLLARTLDKAGIDLRRVMLWQEKGQWICRMLQKAEDDQVSITTL